MISHLVIFKLSTPMVKTMGWLGTRGLTRGLVDQASYFKEIIIFVFKEIKSFISKVVQMYLTHWYRPVMIKG